MALKLCAFYRTFIFYLEEIRIAKGRGQAEDVVPLGVLRNGLHDGPVDDDEVLWRGFH